MKEDHDAQELWVCANQHYRWLSLEDKCVENEDMAYIIQKQQQQQQQQHDTNIFSIVHKVLQNPLHIKLMRIKPYASLTVNSTNVLSQRVFLHKNSVLTISKNAG